MAEVIGHGDLFLFEVLQRAGLDDQSHVRRILDVKVEAVIPASSLFEYAE